MIATHQPNHPEGVMTHRRETRRFWSAFGGRAVVPAIWSQLRLIAMSGHPQVGACL